ncbi:MAG: response regulator transcription factor [Pseudomonadota bacterium]
MTHSSHIRVIVADDHPIVREGISAIVHAQPGFSCVGMAESVATAVECWKTHQPDLGLFDLRMGDGDAIDAISKILEFDRMARIIVISSFDGDEEVYRALKAGARGYLLKDSSPEKIVSAMRNVLSGRRSLESDLADKLADRISAQDLSSREKEILGLAAQGMKNADIAGSLHVTQSTVKFHLNNAYGKLGVSSRTEAISLAHKRGIIQFD